MRAAAGAVLVGYPQIRASGVKDHAEILSSHRGGTVVLRILKIVNANGSIRGVLGGVIDVVVVSMLARDRAERLHLLQRH